MAGATRRVTNGQRGSTLVESSLCLLLFLTIAIGILDCGRVLFLQAALTDRVRGALRYGVLHADDLVAVENVVLWGRPVEQLSPPSFGLTRAVVDVVRSSPGTTDDRITITVSGHQIRLLTPGIAGLVTGRRISASMPVETL
jgi:hypothetical protein